MMTEQTPTTASQSDRKPRIRPLGGARYLVESFTRPGLGHQVDVLRLRCGCEAGSYNRRCKHLVLALEFDAWRRREEAKARAARAAEKQQGQGATWSSAEKTAPATKSAQDGVPVTSSGRAAPVPQTGDLPPLWAHFE